jgi:glycosyltransferase involved in cell wall biosynthesis
MRIVLIGPVYPYRGGIAHHTTMLERSLRTGGHDVLVISFSRQYPRWLYPGVSDKDPSHSPFTIRGEYLLDPIYLWTWQKAIKRILTYKPHLVAIQWWTTFWALPFSYITNVLRKNHIPATYIIHNVLPHEQRVWDRWLARVALGNVKRIIVQSPTEKERLLALIPSMDVSLCAMPAFPKFSEDKSSKSEAKRKLGLNDQTQILLFFGIIRPYKGLQILLDALAILQKQGLKPYLIIAGEFWEDKEAYLKIIDRLHLNPQIRIDDRYIPNEEAHTYFTASDVLIAPYTGGTQSAVAALALGYNLPVILTKQIADGVSDHHSINTHVIPPGDPEALARAIQIVLDETTKIDSKQVDVQDAWGKLADQLVEMGSTNEI